MDCKREWCDERWIAKEMVVGFGARKPAGGGSDETETAGGWKPKEKGQGANRVRSGMQPVSPSDKLVVLKPRLKQGLTAAGKDQVS